MEEQKSSPAQCTFTVSWGTLLKIGVAGLLGYLAIRLWRFEELLLLSLIIAIAFRPMLRWFEKRNFPKWTGVLAASLLLFGLTAVLIGILIPTVGNQGMRFVKDLPRFRDELLQRTPESGPFRRVA